MSLNIKGTLLEHADTADLYAERAAQNAGVFLMRSADYWKGAADTYRLIAEVLLDFRDEREAGL